MLILIVKLKMKSYPFCKINMSIKKSILFETIIFIVFLLLLSVGVMSYNQYNLLPVKLVLSLLLIITFLFVFKKIDKKVIYIFIILGIYLFYSFLHLVLDDTINAIDFLTAYMSFIYLFILLFFINKQFFSIESFNKLFFIILLIASFKYGYSVMMGFTTRPGVFGENNFEILFFILLYISYHANNIKIEKKFLFFMLLIVLLSGSRSGIAIFVAVTFILYFNLKSLKLKYLLYYVGAILICLFFIDMFFSRTPANGIEGIDRYIFYLHFLDEIKDWNFFQYIFGNPILTPLSTETCNDLRYYQSLFSNKNDGSCYSVVLHSFILRLILDHGILGFVFLFYSINYILKISYYSFKHRIAILSALILNGISVSSFNNILIIIGMIIVVTVENKNRILINCKKTNKDNKIISNHVR